MDELVLKIITVKKELEKKEKEFEELKTEALRELDKRNQVKFVYENLGNFTTLQKIERVNITYNIDNIKENLEKELYTEFIDREYKIINFEELKKLFKEAGIKPKQIKSLVETSETINKPKLNKLFETGDISLSDLKGCYVASLSKFLNVKE